jgi:hypothetical protein
MDIERLAAWVAVLAVPWALFVLFARFVANRLSDSERAILTACKERGEIRILSVDGYGEWVRADSKDFFEPKDLAHNAQYLEAFHKLVARGFATHEAGFLYRLTGSGFAIARKLRL